MAEWATIARPTRNHTKLGLNKLYSNKSVHNCMGSLWSKSKYNLTSCAFSVSLLQLTASNAFNKRIVSMEATYWVSWLRFDIYLKRIETAHSRHFLQLPLTRSQGTDRTAEMRIYAVSRNPCCSKPVSVPDRELGKCKYGVQTSSRSQAELSVAVGGKSTVQCASFWRNITSLVNKGMFSSSNLQPFYNCPEIPRKLALSLLLNSSN